MIGFLRDLYEGLKDEYRNRRDPPRGMPSRPSESPPWPTAPRPAEPASAKPIPEPVRPLLDNLAPLKHWSHPFRDKSNPLVQLTNLSKAIAGYYPVGRNGMWHGGVHFDSGTAGVIDQSSVRCIADGEVVAYRVPAQSPRTTYFPAPGITVESVFASAFVLVRHRLQPPSLAGSTDEPPQLVFYSHYLHLEDWASYEADPARKLPAFWRAGSYRVKADVADLGPLGATVRMQPKSGAQLLVTLPRGTLVEVTSADLGFYQVRGLPMAEVPELAEPIRTGRAFMWIADLERAYGVQRVKDNALGEQVTERLNVHAEARHNSVVIATLPRGATIVISGEGEYRKLESVVPNGPDDTEFSVDAYETPQGYVRFSALEPVLAPQQLDSVVVLDEPIPIKAGELIGYIGPYQGLSATSTIRKLHLETFTADNLPKFLEASRAWAQRLPEQEKSWLKIARGTPVVAPRENGPPVLGENGPTTGNDLLVPRSLLEGLPAEYKRAVTLETAAYNWYRLEGLLNDEDGNPLDGWVCEKVGVMPWVSPWHWEGYGIIHDYGPMERSLAYRLSVEGELEEDQRERHRRKIDAWDQGPVQSRLYAIIDSNRDGQLGTEEIRAALGIPARAQSISQLVIRYESEWHYRQPRWDALDELLGHTTSTPHLNWIAEKERIKKISWWSEVAGKVGLPEGGNVYHLHPIGLVAAFMRIANWELGRTSEQYESGGRGAGVISTGVGDHGGASYGRYQFSSNMGVVQKYLAWSKFSPEFSGLSPATSGFNTKWKEVAKKYTDDFSAEQHEFIKVTHYEPQLQVLKSSGLDFVNDRAALQDLIWSTAVQYGPKTKLIVKALAGRDTNVLTDREVIVLVQDYKYLNVEALFESSPGWWNDLRVRANGEKVKLLRLEGEKRIVEL